jgi:alcohol dehydrogenase class IV
MRFEFATAGRIVFGGGCAAELPAAVRAHAARVLVVTGREPRRHGKVLAAIEAAGVACVPFATAGEPTVDLVRSGIAHLRDVRAGVVVAIGGGSAIDCAKAIAALAANPGDPFDYLEVVGKGTPLQAPSLPVVAVPTTAGTGSEVTRNAVLGVPEHQTKVSLRSPLMLPRLAVVDPELTLELPAAVTASS